MDKSVETFCQTNAFKLLHWCLFLSNIEKGGRGGYLSRGERGEFTTRENMMVISICLNNFCPWLCVFRELNMSTSIHITEKLPLKMAMKGKLHFPPLGVFCPPSLFMCVICDRVSFLHDGYVGYLTYPGSPTSTWTGPFKIFLAKVFSVYQIEMAISDLKGKRTFHDAKW